MGINVHECESPGPRCFRLMLSGERTADAPTTGVKELRKAVASLYNLTYRQGMKSQYTYEVRLPNDQEEIAESDAATPERLHCPGTSNHSSRAGLLLMMAAIREVALVLRASRAS